MKIRGQFYSLRFGATDVCLLKKLITSAARSGMNWLCLELDQGLQYERHPELSARWAISKKQMIEVLSHAHRFGLKVVPALPHLTHMEYLLRVHPEFREHPTCRTGLLSGVYCPSHPEIYPFLFDVLDEVLELFESDHILMGHDEAVSHYDERKRVSLFACPRCKKHAPHECFANDINRLHQYLISKKVRMMMWADGLSSPDMFSESAFSQSGCYGGAPDHLHQAIHLLPRDILLCDWRYEPAREYPTLQYYQKMGFDVLGASLFPLNTWLFKSHAEQYSNSHWKGMLITNWSRLQKHHFPVLNKLVVQQAKILSAPRGGGLGKRCTRLLQFHLSSDKTKSTSSKFSWKYDFHQLGMGVLGSNGWRDLRYIEWPDSHDPLKGRSMPVAVEIKSKRRGWIQYVFHAPNRKVFEKVHLQVWMNCPGRNSIVINVPPHVKSVLLLKNTKSMGKKIDLSNDVKKRSSFRLRFECENLTGNKQIFLRKFVVSGTFGS